MASPLAMAGRIVCKDTSLFHAFWCSSPPPSVFYKLLEIERSGSLRAGSIRPPIMTLPLGQTAGCATPRYFMFAAGSAVHTNLLQNGKLEPWVCAPGPPGDETRAGLTMVLCTGRARGAPRSILSWTHRCGSHTRPPATGHTEGPFRCV